MGYPPLLPPPSSQAFHSDPSTTPPPTAITLVYRAQETKAPYPWPNTPRTHRYTHTCFWLSHSLLSHAHTSPTLTPLTPTTHRACPTFRGKKGANICPHSDTHTHTRARAPVWEGCGSALRYNHTSVASPAPPHGNR